MADLDASSLEPRIELYDPNDEFISFDSDPSVAALSYSAAQSGTYTIVLSSNHFAQTGTGNYNLYFIKVHGANEGGLLPDSAVIHGTIDLGDLDTFTLDLTVGESIQLRMADLDVGSLEPRIQLYDPNGAYIDGNSDPWVAALSYTATQNGIFTVVLSSTHFYETGYGNYNLYIVRVPGANEGGLLPDSAVIPGTIDLGDLDTFTLDLTVGESIQLRMADLDVGSLEPRIQLYDPNGAYIDGNSDPWVAALSYTATQNGIFTVVLSSTHFYETGYGNYNLYIVRVPGANEGGLLPDSAVIPGTIDLGDLDTFTLDLTVGESIQLRMADLDVGSLEPRIQLYDPNGAYIDGNSDPWVAALSYTATQNGIFTVVLSSTHFYETGYGNYNLYIVRVPGANEGGLLPDSAVIPGTIDLGDLDTFTLDLTVGESIQLRMADLDVGSLEPRIQLYDPNGAYIDGNSDPWVAALSYTATQTGIFTIVLSSTHFYKTGHGNYMLSRAPFAEMGELILSNDQPYWDGRDPAGPAVVLRWSAQAKADSYEVFRDGLKVYPTTSDTYQGLSFRNEIGLEPGNSYLFHVIARDGSEVWHSNVLDVGPMLSGPNTPILLSASPTNLSNGNSYQEVTLSGENFDFSNWHQFSTNGGVSWFEAISPSWDVTTNSMTVAVNDQVVQEVRVRVCSAYGSIDCSNDVTLSIQPSGEIAPSVSLISPDTAAVGVGTKQVSVFGNSFSSLNRYQVAINDGSWAWSGSEPTSSAFDKLEMEIPIETLGTVEVRVCAGEGSEVCSEPAPVDVVTAPTQTPIVDSVYPDQLDQGVSQFAPVTLTGNHFVEGNWHQISADGENTWSWAILPPDIRDINSVVVRLSDTAAGELTVRMCRFHGSGDCSGTLSVTFVPKEQTPEPEPPQNSGSDKAVILTHGWNGVGDSWLGQMASIICSDLGYHVNPDPGLVKANDSTRLCSTDSGWDVWVIDWRDKANYLSDSSEKHLPVDAYINAVERGTFYSHTLLNSSEYDHVHLIAHSAGAGLIEEIAEYLSTHSPGTTIHQTFLDPYQIHDLSFLAPLPTQITTPAIGLGDEADWTDSYFDTRRAPKLYLPNALNVNATGSLLDCFTTLNWPCTHSRPYRYYGKSIYELYNGYPAAEASDPVTPPIDMGFHLSVESGWSVEDLASNYPENTLCEVSGSTCVFVTSPLTTITRLPVEMWNTIIQSAKGAQDVLINAVEGAFSFTLDTFGSFFDRSLAIGKARTLALQDLIYSSGFEQSDIPFVPTHFRLQIQTEEPVNELRFNWDFGSGGEGLLRVYFDGMLVREIDQRFVDLASLETEIVLLGTGEGPVEPGKHEVLFILDGFSSENGSNVRITDIELGYYQVSVD